jgi:hypothetical protein
MSFDPRAECFIPGKKTTVRIQAMKKRMSMKDIDQHLLLVNPSAYLAIKQLVGTGIDRHRRDHRCEVRVYNRLTIYQTRDHVHRPSPTINSIRLKSISIRKYYCAGYGCAKPATRMVRYIPYCGVCVRSIR